MSRRIFITDIPQVNASRLPNGNDLEALLDRLPAGFEYEQNKKYLIKPEEKWTHLKGWIITREGQEVMWYAASHGNDLYINGEQNVDGLREWLIELGTLMRVDHWHIYIDANKKI